MPSKSKKQQQFFGAELQRAREGKKTQTGLSEETLTDFASTKTRGLPTKAKGTKAKGASE